MTIKYFLFKIARSKDEEVIRVVEEMKKVGVKVLRRRVTSRRRPSVERRESLCTEE